jgi:hypothetical protein
MIPIIKEYNSDGKESYFEDANGEFIIIGTNSYGKLINFYCSTNKMYKDNVQTLNNIPDSLIMVETKASVGRFDSASFNNETKTLTLKRSTFKETIKFNDNYLPIQWENSIGAKEITEYDNKGRIILIKNHRNKFVIRKYDDDNESEVISYEDSNGNYWDKELMPYITDNPFLTLMKT